MTRKRPPKKGPEQSGPARWRNVDGEWLTDDPAQQGFAVVCMLVGFDLPAFDRWLETIGQCAAQADLFERRQVAFEVFKKKGGQGLLRTHLDFLQLAMRHIQADELLRPMAQHHAKSTEQRQRGGRTGTSPRKEKVHEQWLLWQEKPERHSSVKQFKIDMEEQYPGVMGPTISNWMTEWRRKSRS